MTGNELANILETHIPALRELGDNESVDCTLKISINFQPNAGAIWVDDTGVTAVGAPGVHCAPIDTDIRSWIVGLNDD